VPPADVQIEEMPEELVQEEPVEKAEPAAPKAKVAHPKPAEKPWEEEESKIAFKPLKKVEKAKVEAKEEKKEEVKLKQVKVTKKAEAEETRCHSYINFVFVMSQSRLERFFLNKLL